MSLQQRIESIRERIQHAAQKAGRAPSEIRLVAVSKRYAAEHLRAAYALGVRDFGENYVQELVEKHTALQDLTDLKFHLIGHLQRNKARHVVPVAFAIHSLDDAKTALECERRAQLGNHKLEVFIQVNLAGESQKDGCPEAEVPRLVNSILECPHLSLQGLMTIPPATEDANATRPYFRQLRELSETLPVRLPRLSMGMSADFDVAIEEGATDIRVGTALFGART